MSKYVYKVPYPRSGQGEVDESVRLALTEVVHLLHHHRQVVDLSLPAVRKQVQVLLRDLAGGILCQRPRSMQDLGN